MNDDELKSLLRTWQAPPAPPTLRAAVLRERRPFWQWLWSGEVRMPVPVLLSVLVLTAGWMAYWGTTPPRRVLEAVSLTDFEQVKKLEPRIVRINHYEAR